MTSVAVVTGASRGVGRSVAVALSAAGLQVFATGRTVDRADLPAGVVRLACDHRDDAAVEAAFARVLAEAGRVDVLVNSAWAGYERMVEDGRFTWPAPFWEQPRWRWDAMFQAGVRAAYVAGQLAARAMVPAGRGLIVNISYWAARKHLGNAAYGAAKAAVDELSADMAHELRPHGVAALSLYPGLVRTEAVLAAAAEGHLDLAGSESPELTGRVIAALWRDPDLLRLSGGVHVGATLARAYGVTDIDGSSPEPLTLERA
jgi:NAD(P)-dependent dehydrogenase (short-subunit alcohol dehydrogenase family)